MTYKNRKNPTRPLGNVKGSSGSKFSVLQYDTNYVAEDKQNEVVTISDDDGNGK